MSRIRSYIKTFALWELMKGLSVTFRNFFKPAVTVYYPEEKAPQSPRFRGLHAQHQGGGIGLAGLDHAWGGAEALGAGV